MQTNFHCPFDDRSSVHDRQVQYHGRASSNKGAVGGGGQGFEVEVLGGGTGGSRRGLYVTSVDISSHWFGVLQEFDQIVSISSRRVSSTVGSSGSSSSNGSSSSGSSSEDGSSSSDGSDSEGSDSDSSSSSKLLFYNDIPNMWREIEEEQDDDGGGSSCSDDDDTTDATGNNNNSSSSSNTNTKSKAAATKEEEGRSSSRRRRRHTRLKTLNVRRWENMGSVDIPPTQRQHWSMITENTNIKNAMVQIQALRKPLTVVGQKEVEEAAGIQVSNKQRFQKMDMHAPQMSSITRVMMECACPLDATGNKVKN